MRCSARVRLALGGCSFVTEIIELEQLERTPILSAPELRRYRPRRGSRP